MHITSYATITKSINTHYTLNAQNIRHLQNWWEIWTFQYIYYIIYLLLNNDIKLKLNFHECQPHLKNLSTFREKRRWDIKFHYKRKISIPTSCQCPIFHLTATNHLLPPRIQILCATLCKFIVEVHKFEFYRHYFLLYFT